jgi:hypothetical protein
LHGQATEGQPGAGTLERLTAEAPAEKLARQRLKVLQLAQALASLASACRNARMDLTSFTDRKRRFQLHGLAGLKNLPSVNRSNPSTTPL